MARQKAATQSPPRKRLAPNVIALGLVSFFTDASTEIVYPLLPLFLGALGATPLFIGLVEGIAEATASLLKLVSGWLSDRLGKRKAVILGGYGLSSLTRPLMALAMAPWHVLAVRFLDRVGKGFRGAPRDALLADSCDADSRGRAFGFHRAMDHAGAVVGPLIAFALLSTVFAEPGETSPAAYRAVFWVATIPAAFAVAVIVLRVREIAPAAQAEREPLRISPSAFDATFKRFVAVSVLFTLGNSADAFLLLKAKDAGVAVAWIPMLWVLLHLVKTASSVPGSAWSDRVGRRRALVMGWAVYATIYSGFAFAAQAWQIWVLFAAYGIYFGLTEGSEKALIADLVPAHTRASAYGLHGFAVGVAALPASFLMGLVWTRFSSRDAFLLGAAMAVASTLLLSTVVLRRHPPAR